MTDEDDILAAEFALGLLEESEAEAAQARARTDAAFSLRIAWWRDQLSPLVSEVEVPAPDRVWSRIAARLPGNDNSATRLQRWRVVAIGAMAVAAALLVFIGMRPGPPPVIPVAAPMMAAVVGEKGAVVAISYDVATGKLLVAPTVLDAGQGDAELWIIPDGGAPVSLGIMDAKAARDRMVAADRRALFKAGATLAISQEEKNGSPDGTPHGPIIATGKIIRT